MSFSKIRYSFNHFIDNGNILDRAYWRKRFNHNLIYPLLLPVMLLTPAAPVMAQTTPVQVSQTQGENQIVYLQPGQDLVVDLEYNPATGHTWKLEGQNLASLPVQLVKREFHLKSNLLGAPVVLKLHFKGKWAGATQLKFVYLRPWEQYELPAKQLKVNVQTVGSFPSPAPQTDNLLATNALNDDPANLMKIPVEEEVIVDHRPPKPSTDESQSRSTDAPSLESGLSLPTSFNWCDDGGCTPVKDQRSCGSCWAFGTVGPLESAILIKTSQTKDLAEQYLVSCNSDGWSCNGGWFAHNYHWNKKIPVESDAGAVYESDFPYVARNDACNSSHPHSEKLTNWRYVSNSYSAPSTEAIKQAIQTYGPVAAAVCVGSGFQSYRGGIFSTDETSSCGGSVNHAIVLVGWDDSQGVWILRNSWNTWWGEQGYMRIKYGISNVGYAANYVIFPGSTYTLTVSKAGAGSGTVTSNPAGISCGADCSKSYASDTVVTLTATPASGATFAGWSGACSGAGACQVTMSQAQTVTATFTATAQYNTLSVSKTGTGSGTVTSNPAGINCGTDCSEPYASGTVVTLTATPASGATFAGWSGACSGADACQVTMSQAQTVTATFTATSRYTLTVSKTGTGSGKVTSGPAGINCGIDCREPYASGTVATLIATPASGSTFTGWSGACSGAGACQVTLSQARAVTASFSRNRRLNPPN